MTSGHEMKAAETTYDGFIAMLKWAIVAVVIVTVTVVVLIA